MAVREFVSACAAAALLASSPVVAQSASPLSVTHSPAARAGAPAGGENLRGEGNTLWYVIGAVAVVLVILWATDTWPFDDNDSESP